MNKKINTVLLALAGVVLAPAAMSQTCTQNQGALASGSSMAIDTCSAGDHLAAACSSLSPIGTAPDAIWSVTVGSGASGNITITPTGTAWDPYLLLMAGSCADSSTCVIDSDNNGAGTGAAFAEGGTIPTTPGTYYLLITDESGTTSCGTGTLDVGTLPVKLQKFSVN